MYSILGLTLQELSLKTHNDQRFGLTEEQREAGRVEAVRFGESVIGRELLHYLPVHKCNRGCDSLELSVAEEFAAKRPRNTQGLSIFVKRFNFNIRRAEGEMLQAMKENNWSTMQYLEAWLNEFLLRGIDVLHGDLAPQELLGNGYALETWERFSGFLSSVDPDGEAPSEEPPGND